MRHLHDASEWDTCPRRPHRHDDRDVCSTTVGEGQPELLVTISKVPFGGPFYKGAINYIR